MRNPNQGQHQAKTSPAKNTQGPSDTIEKELAERQSPPTEAVARVQEPPANKAKASTIAAWAVQKQYDDISINLRVIWDLYLKFFTVFLTYNGVALAWFVARPGQAQFIAPEVRSAVVWVFAVQDVLATVTSLCMAAYTYKARAQVEQAGRHLIALADRQDETTVESEWVTCRFPFKLGVWGGGANAVAIAMVAWVWFRVGFYPEINAPAANPTTPAAVSVGSQQVPPRKK